MQMGPAYAGGELGDSEADSDPAEQRDSQRLAFQQTEQHSIEHRLRENHRTGGRAAGPVFP